MDSGNTVWEAEQVVQPPLAGGRPLKRDSFKIGAPSFIA
jgi:hypothetical protein